MKFEVEKILVDKGLIKGDETIFVAQDAPSTTAYLLGGMLGALIHGATIKTYLWVQNDEGVQMFVLNKNTLDYLGEVAKFTFKDVTSIALRGPNSFVVSFNDKKKIHIAFPYKMKGVDQKAEVKAYVKEMEAKFKKK